GAGTMMTEPILYSASGAYDFQYLDFAVDKYRRDAGWIHEHIGIDISEMATIARELKALHERKFNGPLSSLFFLYDLVGEGANRLIDLLKITKQKAIADHRSHDGRLLFQEKASE
ncbi:MAG TPA: hypothetical protein VEV41_07400, partial [Terriglobales bacterium]|nr:hypothetical protein [Terriglobales bacterium]